MYYNYKSLTNPINKHYVHYTNTYKRKSNPNIKSPNQLSPSKFSIIQSIILDRISLSSLLSLLSLMQKLVNNQKTQRIHNYLRVIAQIFYENYDQKKFHIILERIIKQINRIQSPKSDKPLSFQEEETFLGQSTLPEYKQKINNLIQKRNKQSKRVYVIMSVLFIAIFILLMVFICKKWC